MARSTPDIPNSSMADIAFLLLTFFLMTTTVASDKGLLILLPPPPEALPPDEVEIPERNIFKIQINSSDKLLVEGNPWFSTSRELTDQIKIFILNDGRDPTSSDSPLKAIVSLKADRGTTHKKFIEVLDAAQAAYHEIYANRAGVSVKRWREISSDPNESPETKQAYDRGRDVGPNGTVGIPMALSIAEPSKVGG
ncbi:MAG: biopolymer transporter ExbD [Cyclobacteriaceae bacterium]|nr:biopolymer transporter ExbD [Cyclobacteriaceae bacterium]MDH4297045.1 biopolymer transporter ExbD [Cyclobacteriaceae bacterium]MDH5248687.1 biopolymer transporter ExbD [Cyclobacteriaceae bacterium]